MKKSLRERLLLYLQRHGGLVNGGQLEKLAEANGYKASTASRRLRELENDNFIEAEYLPTKHGSKSVWYRSKQVKKKVAYRNPETGEILAVVYE